MVNYHEMTTTGGARRHGCLLEASKSRAFMNLDEKIQISPPVPLETTCVL